MSNFDDVGITWKDIHDFSTVFPIYKTYYYLLMDGGIYFVLAWYISNVFPGMKREERGTEREREREQKRTEMETHENK